MICVTCKSSEATPRTPECRKCRHRTASLYWSAIHPSRRKEIRIASARRRARQIAERGTTKRRLKGVKPRSRCVGPLSNGWRGGRIMHCSFLGCLLTAGYRHPYEIRKNKTGFFCEKHRQKGRWIGRRIEAVCTICAAPLGQMALSRFRGTKHGHFCPDHSYHDLKPKAAPCVHVTQGAVIFARSLCRACWRPQSNVQCAVCGQPCGYRPPISRKKNQRGYFCTKHKWYHLRKEFRDAI